MLILLLLLIAAAILAILLIVPLWKRVQQESVRQKIKQCQELDQEKQQKLQDQEKREQKLQEREKKLRQFLLSQLEKEKQEKQKQEKHKQEKHEQEKQKQEKQKQQQKTQQQLEEELRIQQYILESREKETLKKQQQEDYDRRRHQRYLLEQERQQQCKKKIDFVLQHQKLQEEKQQQQLQQRLLSQQLEQLLQHQLLQQPQEKQPQEKQPQKKQPQEEQQQPKFNDAYICYLKNHPASKLAGPEFVANLEAYRLYAWSSVKNKSFLEKRFSVYTQEQSKIPAHTLLMDIGKKPRVTLITGSNFRARLVFRLMSLPAVCSRKASMSNASCIISYLRNSVLCDQADYLFQKGNEFKDKQLYSRAAESWAQAILFKHKASHAFLSTSLIDGTLDVPTDGNLAFMLASIGTDLGCADSQGVFARCLISGVGVKEDRMKALDFGSKSFTSGSCFGQHALGLDVYNFGRKQYLSGAAMRGHADAQYKLAIFIRPGSGLDEGAIEAKRWLNLAAAQGHVKAQHYLAEMLHGENLNTDAVRFYKLAAKQGCVESQFKLANMFATGNHVEQDYPEAVRFYKLAVAQGHVKAQLNLGDMFASGCGVEHNDVEAVKHYSIAATKCCTACERRTANFKLACMLANGRGIERNKIKAMIHYCIVLNVSPHKINNPQSIQLYNHMASKHLNVFTDAEVVGLFRLAASHGITIAQYNLAVMIANGRGDTQDNDEAIRLYTQARRQGYESVLACLFAEDVTLLEIAATRNCLSAQIDLGNHFRVGNYYSDKNPVESVKFYHLAAEQGCVVAQYWLGWMYHYTQCGIDSRVKAIKEAEKWYTLAAEQGFPAAFNGLKQLRRSKK